MYYALSLKKVKIVFMKAPSLAIVMQGRSYEKAVVRDAHHGWFSITAAYWRQPGLLA